MDANKRLKIGNKISIVTILVNVFLSLLKFIIGIIGNSSALLSDAVHSLSDVITTFCVMFGLKISEKPEDKDHPYGHEKFEPILTKVLSFILFATAISIGIAALKTLSEGSTAIPSKITMLAAIISILTKEWMFRYTMKGAKEINSSSLEADAWHHRSDSLSSIGSLIGIIGARMGFAAADPIASIVICLIILKASVDIFLQATNQVVDKATDDETIKNIEKITLSVEGVKGIDSLKTRIHSNKLFIDLEISACKDMSFVDAHNIAEDVHKKIEETIPSVKHCTVHINPCEKTTCC